MKVSKQQSARNRERILAEAARLFREHGLSGVGVDALTEAAGLTHGSLYSQFGSKERLAAEALTAALAESALALPPPEGSEAPAALGALVDRYLSARHRDAAGEGCALPALGSEMPRHGPAVRAAYTEGVRGMARRVAALLPDPAEAGPRDDAALAAVATLVGAIMLSRAVDDPDLSDRILAAARRRLAAEIAGPGPGGEPSR